ncbi:Uncharacterised protein [Mycobacteroides abscessus subsp. abscessus]|nr:Uncharacterised protein [Mycobacteroides abscessus subsp. abscessus]
MSTLRVVPRAIPTMAPWPGEVIEYTALPESPWSAGNPSISNQPLLMLVTVPHDSPVVTPLRHTGRPVCG